MPPIQRQLQRSQVSSADSVDIGTMINERPNDLNKFAILYEERFHNVIR